jgi:hypothetical protein
MPTVVDDFGGAPTFEQGIQFGKVLSEADFGHSALNPVRANINLLGIRLF